MEVLLNPYQVLLEAYTEQVKGLEQRKKKEEEEHHVSWIPYRVLNTRMFTYDEYLTNVHYGGFCFEEKNRVMPHLIRFLAAYEKSSEEEKKEFEKLKIKNEYQRYLDELYEGTWPFVAFLESMLKELHYKEMKLQAPYPPKRKNATKQLSIYRDEKKEYEENIKSINRCRAEVNERLQLFKDLI